MFSRSIITLLYLVLPVVAFAQDYNYVHFDTRDGLAGSTVYDMCQDKDGFMWFATENGLCRYDGTHFTNFTVKDGLPDNEVLKVFADSRGRVWIGSLSKEIAYYFKGKIYTKTNAVLLNDSALNINGFKFCEDAEGNIALTDYKKIVQISTNNRISILTDFPVFKKINYRSVYVLPNPYGNGFIVVLDGDAYAFKEGVLKLIIPWKNYPGNTIGILRSDGSAVYLISPSFILGETMIGVKNRYESTVDGAWAVDTLNFQLREHFLPGKRISCTIDDQEGNIWFSTLGEGVYKLASKQMKTFQFVEAGNREVFSISAYSDKIVAGLGFSKFVVLKADQLLQMNSYDAELRKSANALSTNRMYKCLFGTDKNLYLGFDGFLAKLANGKTTFGDIVSIKSISEFDEKYLLVGNHAHAYKVRKADLQVVDTFWRGRCTDVGYYNGMYYVGTMEGLYKVVPGQHRNILQILHPALQGRIVRIVKGKSGKLYVATADKGLVVLKNDEPEYVFNDRNGLSSSICKSLFIDDNYLWLGTNKGLNKISLKKPYQIIKYSVSDGLPSDIINDVLVQDSLIWVASPKGLTYFNEGKMGGVSNCNLLLLGVRQNGKKTAKDSYELSFRQNRISFSFVAISHKSSGDIKYYYKLGGIDSNYKKIDQTEISFLSLPPGDYHFSLYAVNKFGKKSKTIVANIIVQKPVWRTWWFYFIILAVTSAITARLVSNQNISKRKRLERRNRFQRQLASLEQQALQAQMNPHFIFNCLNSIQQFMLTNNKDKANQYLNGFALLIRQTLNISTKTSIPIEDEVAYLNKYLEMEKMRFGAKFDFSIFVDPVLLNRKVEVPSLLIQPYVENALRHGIRYKEDGLGKVDVIFSKKENMISCRVIDNGVGREKAAEFKGMQHIEYQSKGTQLTAKRIRLLNMINDSELSSEIIDLYDEWDKPVGTEVIIKIPLFPIVSPN